ncbi:MAG: hypothetical protein K8F62_13200, partial [Pseudorhodoplanes sp.]|nr:hypothetical protein [Pseudorhodoplanes sp.]
MLALLGHELPPFGWLEILRAQLVALLGLQVTKLLAIFRFACRAGLLLSIALLGYEVTQLLALLRAQLLA